MFVKKLIEERIIMPKISVVIITLNEERNLERCLNSVTEIAEEILIVDSFSTDRTEEIARKYQARFIQHEFQGYIEQKKWATQQAKYDYILSLDADEALSDELKKSILEVKNNWTHDGYTFNRLTNYCGKWIKHTSWYPSRKLRLFDRRKGQWQGIKVHEKFVMDKNASIKHIKGDLLHYSFYTIGQQIEQINKFSEMQSAAFYFKGNKFNNYHIVVRPFWRFFRDYFIKFGFLDGIYGFVISLNGAYEVFLKYLKLKKIIDSESKKSPYRICFFTTNKNNKAFEYQYINDIEEIGLNQGKAFLYIRKDSDLFNICKNNQINYIEEPFVTTNILNFFHLLNMFKRLRVRAFVVNNLADAQFLSQISRIGIKQELYFHIGEDIRTNNKLIKYLSGNNLISRILVNKNIELPEELRNMEKVIYLENNSINNSHIKKQYQVGILLDKLHRPNCGLGRVSIDFSKALVEFSKNNNHFQFQYFVFGKSNTQHLQKEKIQRIRNLNRIIPARTYVDIFHELHQTPSFIITGGNKKIITIHDLNFLITKSKRKAKRYLKEVQRTINKATAIVYISNFTKEICNKNLKINPLQKQKVIYNGVNITDDLPVKPSFVHENDKYLFTIGQFLPKKNFHVLIPFLKKLNMPYKLIIAGENNSSYGAYIRKIVNYYQIENSVIIPGVITESEKKYLYQNCEAFLFPSLAEGFGLPIIEAMLNKKPVFCSNKTSLQEIGDNNVYFWTTFEADEMVRIFKFGMTNFDENKKEKAYKYALQFTWQKNVEEYYNLYKEVLSEENTY
jgi:glycosyltransferase involved in cell wall biosynthesis